MAPSNPVRLNHAVLFGVGTSGGPKRRGAIGLYHLAWQLDPGSDNRQQTGPRNRRNRGAP